MADLASMAAADAFLQRCLDWIPARHLIPLTDEEKDAQWRRSTQKSAFTVKKQRGGAEEEGEEGAGRQEKKRARLGVTNADLVRSAAERALHADAAARKLALAVETVPRPSATRAADPSELRERLAQRIIELRKQNGVAGSRAERDKLLPPKAERKRLKREAVAAAGGTNGVSAPSSSSSPGESNISFGVIKISGGDEANHGKAPVANKELSTKSIFNVKKLIKKAEASQERLARLKLEGKSEQVEEELWETAEKKALGEKMRDDPRKLKRALKRLETKKKKSGEAWTERKAQVDEAKKERVDTREKNLEQRKKKGKRRPGFEGAELSSRKTAAAAAKSKGSHEKGKNNTNNGHAKGGDDDV